MPLRLLILNFLYAFYRPRVRRICRFLCIFALVGFAIDALADDGEDMLAGTDSSAWATFKGTGKSYIYLAEVVVSIIAYVTSKNIKAFLGVVVIAIFINVALKMAGHS